MTPIRLSKQRTMVCLTLVRHQISCQVRGILVTWQLIISVYAINRYAQESSSTASNMQLCAIRLSNFFSGWTALDIGHHRPITNQMTAGTSLKNPVIVVQIITTYCSKYPLVSITPCRERAFLGFVFFWSFFLSAITGQVTSLITIVTLSCIRNCIDYSPPVCQSRSVSSSSPCMSDTISSAWLK